MQIDRIVLQAIDETPRTPDEIVGRVFERIEPDQRERFAIHLTPNVVVAVLAGQKSLGRVIEGRRHIPYQNAIMKQRHPQGQPVRTYHLALQAAE